ncbi:hypothetical protein [Streptomyces sp. Rer75]|nr:hypothetical protein [Streptomyces sp. Rer75]QLH26315.1 hypothetical protein HYQ63_41565 [Streptomyces sp. Rer75]
MRSSGLPPAPQRTSQQTWRAFLLLDVALAVALGGCRADQRADGSQDGEA